MTTQGSAITDEMKKVIGVESEPTVIEVEKEPIRRFAEAIGDPNPVYHDVEHARKLGYRSIIAPPGFHPQYCFPIKKGKSEGPRFRSPHTRMLNGGNEYEFFQPIQAGDMLSMTTRIADIYERPGRMGNMLFIITENVFRNQKNEMVLIMRHVGISY
jgi:hypothetical protein